MMWPRKVTEGYLGVFIAWPMSFWGPLFIFSESDFWGPGTPPCGKNTRLGSGLLVCPSCALTYHVRSWSLARSGDKAPFLQVLHSLCTRWHGEGWGWWVVRRMRWLPLSSLPTWLPPPPFLYKVGSSKKALLPSLSCFFSEFTLFFLTVLFLFYSFS